jgi:cbb3-type cytochrome oxidase cytochrome c subunit
MERLTTVLFVAGIGCFAFAWSVMGYLPLSHIGKIPVKTLEEIAPEPSEAFVRLAEMYPESFAAAFGEPTTESFHDALRRARDVYVGEACWHCHSQFVRPVSNEDIRFGAVSTAAEYQTEMQLPQLLGTRRVGPDLSREWNKRSVDWHVAHFFEPTDVVPTSVMPNYRWFFDENDHPNRDGIAIVTYVMWLGSWTEGWDDARAAAREAEGSEAGS